MVPDRIIHSGWNQLNPEFLSVITRLGDPNRCPVELDDQFVDDLGKVIQAAILDGKISVIDTKSTVAEVFPLQCRINQLEALRENYSGIMSVVKHVTVNCPDSQIGAIYRSDHLADEKEIRGVIEPVMSALYLDSDQAGDLQVELSKLLKFRDGFFKNFLKRDFSDFVGELEWIDYSPQLTQQLSLNTLKVENYNKDDEDENRVYLGILDQNGKETIRDWMARLYRLEKVFLGLDKIRGASDDILNQFDIFNNS